MTVGATTICVSPRDPMIVRDGRPFGETQRRMRALDWPYPSVLTGSLRTLVAKSAGREFSDDVVRDLERIRVCGPFPQARETLYFPAPADVLRVPVQADESVVALRPERVESGGGCDLPAGMQPVLPPGGVPTTSKPLRIPMFWSLATIQRWLSAPLGDGFRVDWRKDALEVPFKEERTHVSIEVASGAAAEGLLFSTAGLALESLPRSPVQVKDLEPAFLVLRAEAEGWTLDALRSLNAFHPAGGERRLVHWRSEETGPWECPESLLAGLKNARRVRMMLASPAIFSDGWKPGWLKPGQAGFEGTIPDSNVEVRLRGASLSSWLPISGWSLKPPVGPKAIRRLVPAGAVYFFEIQRGDPTSLGDRWLRSVCDEPQDRRDGFGLALWGTWDCHQNA